MEIRFTKIFETTEQEAKQSTLSETGIRLDSNGRPVDYETIPVRIGMFRGEIPLREPLLDVLAWIETPGETIHRLRHPHGWHVRLRVDPKQERWLAAIEIESESPDYNRIKRSLEENGWEERPFRSRRTQAPLSRVLAKITEIAEKSADGDYIYRGEPECYCKVSSNLYRKYEPDIDSEDFDIAVVQEEILTESRKYTTYKMDDSEILAELQHYGGKTNLIDFTTDYLVALFFACEKNLDKPGKVILLPNQSEAYEVVKPPRTIPRVGFQKSIFVQSPTGVVVPDTDTVVCIPADLKEPMLDYLRKHHDISSQTIYNDLQGFIKNRSDHKSWYTEYYTGLTCQKRGHSEKDPAKKKKWYYKAVGHYTETIALAPEYTDNDIDLPPRYAVVYTHRGNAYAAIGDFEAAIADYDKAIELNPAYAAAYYSRGVAWLHLQEWENARAGLTTAREMGINIAAAFHNDYESVADFEAQHGVQVPEDIAALLSQH